jgi:GDP-mannose 4,6-dehydratase
LLSKGETVIGTYRWNEDLSRTEKYKDKIQMIPMDLTDLSSCIKATHRKIDYVYHLAAQSFVPDSYVYPEATIQANIVGTYNLLEAIRLDGEPYPVIMICSSSEVYGQVTKDEIPIKESQPFRPQSPYAVSKCGADLLGRLYYDNYKMPIIRTRMFTHTGYGRTMDSAEVSFAKQIVRIEKGLQKPIVKVGNLDSIRTWLDVKDAVRAYWLLVRSNQFGGVFNIGGDTTKTIREMLQYLLTLSKAKGITVNVEQSRLRPSDVTLQIPDISLFKSICNWQPEISFKETMSDLLRYWREQI